MHPVGWRGGKAGRLAGGGVVLTQSGPSGLEKKGGKGARVAVEAKQKT